MTINHRKQKLRDTTFFRDLLECLLIGEGNETGRYIFGLCFPMVPPYAGWPHREPEAGGRAERTSWVGRKRAQELAAGCFAKSAKR